VRKIVNSTFMTLDGDITNFLALNFFDAVIEFLELLFLTFVLRV